MARYVAVERRDAVDRRVRKDLRVESEARMNCNEASVKNTRNN
jgi:hypothetical protein